MGNNHTWGNSSWQGGTRSGNGHSTFTPQSTNRTHNTPNVTGNSGNWRNHIGGGNATQTFGRSTGHVGSATQRPSFGPRAGSTSTFTRPSGRTATGDHRGRPQFKVDGRAMTFARDHGPRQVDGHWTAPLRSFSDRIGAKLWETNDHYWHMSRGGHDLRFRIGDRHGWFDGRQVTFLVAPYMYGGSLYCNFGEFSLWFGVPYGVTYLPQPYPVYVPVTPDAGPAPTPAISQGLAIANATQYLRQVGAYPQDCQNVDAHLNTAPENRFWDLVTTGHDPIADAPMRWCWIVEFDYPGGWQQVFVDAMTGEPVGGSAS